MQCSAQKKPKVVIALGSGGLRGLAHIGVLRVLERESIPVDAIVGCSIGSLIGALYCSGMPLESIEKLARHLKRRHWLDFSIPKLGLFAGERILNMLRLLTRNKSFSDLSLPLAVVATDLQQGKEVVFTSGEVAMAVRASTSVPGIFVPCELDGMILVDGAVLNPTPIDVARKMDADVVIAVDLAYAGSVCSITNMFDVIIQSIDIMERELLKTRESACDVLIRPAVAHISPSSFERAVECIALGEAAATEMLPQIRHALKTCGKTENVENQLPLTEALC